MNSNVEEFYNILSQVCDPLFKKKINSNQRSDCSQVKQPWFDESCRAKRKEFYNRLNTFRSHNSDENRNNLTTSRTEYKKCIRSSKKSFDNKQTIKLEKARFQNARDYWKLLKGVCTPQKSNSLTADMFTLYFKAINDPGDIFFQPDDDIIFFNERYLNGEMQVMFDELNVSLTVDEIQKAIGQLNLRKSCGPDNIINEFFKYGTDNLVSYVCRLFNAVFSSGYFPSKWSEGYIVPLHKKGSINEVENYRGITLLSVFGKLFSRVLNNRLSAWAEDYHIYIEAQAGFRKEMGTIDNIFILHGLIKHFINESKRLYVAFIDFTKAFDYVVRDNLWLKLIKFGVRGKILNVIQSMYGSVKSMVKYNNSLSDDFECYLGVRQGECLSPFLFSMYLNDIEETFIRGKFQGIEIGMLKLFLLLYADDIVIFADNENMLQKGLEILYEYCTSWKLKVNTNKTKIMIFRGGGILSRNLHFLYSGEKIEIVSKFTYLGIVFSTGGSFTDTFETLAGQGRKALFKLYKYLEQFTSLSAKHVLDLFDKLIKPVLHYGCEIWGFQNAAPLERLHTQFCKRLLGVKRSTQNDFVYGELGRTTLKNYRLTSVIRYWFKILTCTDTKYVKLVYEMMLNDLNLRPNKPNWAYYVKHLLESLGFNNVWLNQGVGNINRFMLIFRERLTDTFIQNWNERIHTSTRARSYSLFCDFSYKAYLEVLKIEKYRMAMSRIRLSSHRLMIETGRWHRPHSIPYEERKCIVCDTIEDEFHFILECSIYADIRKKYINRYYWSRPNVLKFNELMTSSNPRIVKNLASFVFEGFQIRYE